MAIHSSLKPRIPHSRSTRKRRPTPEQARALERKRVNRSQRPDEKTKNRRWAAGFKVLADRELAKRKERERLISRYGEVPYWAR